MKPPTTPILIAAAVLRQALAGLGRVLPRNSTLPVLSTVRVIRHRGTITFSATDLDHHLTYTHRTEDAPITDLAKALAEMQWAREPAEGICIPASALRMAAKGKGDILIGPKALTFGGTTLPFEGIPVAEFPALTVPLPFTPVCTFDGAARTALLHAADFISSDETRYILNGVYLEAKGKEPQIAATDGRRLYMHPLPCLSLLAENVVLPSAALAVLGSPAFVAHDWHLSYMPGKGGTQPPSEAAMKDYEAALAVWKGKDKKIRDAVPQPNKPKPVQHDPKPFLRFRAGPWELTSNLIEGNFPNYRQVIPKYDDPITVTFTDEQANQFHSVLAKWPQTKADDDAIYLAFPGTGLRLSDKNGTVHLLPGVRSTQPLGIAANRHYLADAVALGTPVLSLFASDAAMNFTIGPATVIVMPLRGDPVPCEDAEREAAEKEWKGSIVHLPKNGTGKVIELVRNGSKIVATVQDGAKPPVRLVPLATMKLHDRPAKAA